MHDVRSRSINYLRAKKREGGVVERKTKQKRKRLSTNVKLGASNIHEDLTKKKTKRVKGWKGVGRCIPDMACRES